MHAEPWPTEDKLLFGTALAASALDWAQTRSIAREPQRFQEFNPFLPPHPSVGRVNSHFIMMTAGTIGLAFVLPVDKRRQLLLGVTAIETALVLNNHMAGIRVRF